MVHLLCDLLSLTFCSVHEHLRKYFNSKSTWHRKKILQAGKTNIQNAQLIPKQWTVFFLRRNNGKKKKNQQPDSGTFISGYYSCVDTKRLLKADSERRAAGYHETGVGWHLRGSWDRRKNVRILTLQILFKQCSCLFKGYPETHTMETFVCRA